MKKLLFQLILVFFLTACTTAQPVSPPATPTDTPARPRSAIGTPATLPTAAPPTAVKPTNTLVMANPWTPTPVPSATPLPAQTLALVVKVISAGAVEVVLEGDLLQKTYIVRLIGVDAPADPPADPWGVVAVEKLNGLLANKVVRLVQDTTAINPAGELPRYLYLGDTLINRELLETGLAKSAFSAPDVALKEELEAAAQESQGKTAGVWGPDPTVTPTFTATPNISATVALTGTPALTVTATVTTTPALKPAAALTATPVLTATATGAE